MPKERFPLATSTPLLLRARHYATAVPAPTKIVWGMVVVWTAVLATFAILRYTRLNASTYDFAIQAQVIWNSAHGRLFASTLEVDNYLGDHVQPILLLFTPLVWLWPNPKVLLIAQAFLLSVGAIPIHRLARRHVQHDSLALAFALVYLLYPALGFINRFDFHPDILALPLLLFAYDALDHERWTAASVLVLLTMLVKEDFGLTIAVWGLYVGLAKRHYRIGVLWAVGGIAWSLLALFVIIPYFRQGASDTLWRYAWLGDDPMAMLATLLTRPFTVLTTLAADPQRQQFILGLLLPVAFLALFAPTLLLIALPSLAYNLLSSIPSQHSIYFHYTIPIIPFIFMAAIMGTHRLQEWLQSMLAPRTAAWLLITILALGTAGAWVRDNPFTRPIDEPYYPVYALEKHSEQTAWQQAQALIPTTASVATSMAYAPHLAFRPEIYLFYHKGRLEERVYDFPQADYLLLSLTDLRWWVNPRVYYTMIESAIGRDGYEAVFFADDVLLLTHTPQPQPLTGAALQRVLDLQEAGGKFAPTAPETSNWIIGRWLPPQLPPTAQKSEIAFDQGFTLLGYEMPATATRGGTLCITLYWQNSAPPATAYTVFLHLRDQTGYVHTQRDGAPIMGYYPTSAWSAEQIVQDLRCLALSPTLPQEEYHLAVGLYDGLTGQRLARLAPTDSAADLFALPPLTIAP